MPFRDNWFSSAFGAVLRSGLDRYAIALERARLPEMSDAELSDIGVSRRAALGEAMRPFWQGRRCR